MHRRIGLFVAFAGISLMVWQGMAIAATTFTCKGRQCLPKRCDDKWQDCTGQAAGATCYWCPGGDISLCVRGGTSCTGEYDTAEGYCSERWKGTCNANGKCDPSGPDTSIKKVKIPGAGGRPAIIVTVEGCYLIAC